MIFIWVFFWITMACIVAIVAASKGRSGFQWFLYGLALMPIALVHVNIIKAPGQSGHKSSSTGGLRLSVLSSASPAAPFSRQEAPHKNRWIALWLIAAVAVAAPLIYFGRAARLSSALVAGFCFGLLILFQAGFALRGGFRYGRFRLGFFTARASRSAQPAFFWVLVLMHAALAIVACAVLLLAAYATTRVLSAT